MDELIVRSLQGKATASEELEIHDWRRLSQHNDRHYREMARLWTMVRSTGLDGQRATPPSASELLRQLPPRERAAGPALRIIRSRTTARARHWGIAVAAVLAIVAGIVGVRLQEADGVALGAAEFVTGESQMVTAQLGDGSVVRLAPRSRLRIGSVRGRRDVWLEGRAFFVIAKQSGGRPFTVHTHVGEAVALGTRFEVDARNDRLRLATIEGRVALSASGTRVEVEKGETGSVVRGTPPSVVEIEDMRPLFDWMGRFLGFQATPLTDVGREIERQYGVRVRIHDRMLAEQTVTAWFSDESLEDVVAVICRVVDAQCSIDDTNVDMRLRRPAAR